MQAASVIVALVLVGLATFLIFDKTDTGNPAMMTNKNTSNMQIKSSAFTDGETIPSKYTCDGEDISPDLAFSDIPENTQSLLLIFDDPDSPTGTWLHWTLWNIAPDTHILPEGYQAAEDAEGTTSFGNIGYGGPCPGSGEHRYFFKLFALDTSIELPRGAHRDEVEGAMEGHVVEQAELMGLYSRN